MTVIEKHFTFSRDDGGVDSEFSLEPQELRAPVVETDRCWRSFGAVACGPTEAESASVVLRRSLYIAQDLEPAFHDAGQFYIGRRDAWLEERDLFSKKSRMLLLPRWRVQDIDTIEDWKRAELIFELQAQKTGKRSS